MFFHFPGALQGGLGLTETLRAWSSASWKVCFLVDMLTEASNCYRKLQGLSSHTARPSTVMVAVLQVHGFLSLLPCRLFLWSSTEFSKSTLLLWVFSIHQTFTILPRNSGWGGRMENLKEFCQKPWGEIPKLLPSRSDPPIRKAG